MRLVDADGVQIGIVDIKDALSRAEEAGLDLVEVSPNAEPPVCRILDYGKMEFTAKKKRAGGPKKVKRTQLKELKIRPVTEEADYLVKLRNAIRFLNAGNKVKITMRFRGREMAHKDHGLRLLERMRDDLSEYGVVEQEPKLEGRQMIMVFGPSRSLKQSEHQ